MLPEISEWLTLEPNDRDDNANQMPPKAFAYIFHVVAW